MELSRDLGDDVHGSIYLFGYHPDRPFGSLPKIHLKFTRHTFHAYDQDRYVADFPAVVTHTDNELLVRIPLHALGMPDRVIANAAVYHRDGPLDAVAWRILHLKPPTELADASIQR